MWSMVLLAACFDGGDYPGGDGNDTWWRDTSFTRDSDRVSDTWAGPVDTAEPPPSLELSALGRRLADALALYGGSQGATWSLGGVDSFYTAPLQTPGQAHWSQPAAEVDFDATCFDDDCHPDLHLPRCDAATCGEGTTCLNVSATQREPGDAPEALCVTESDAHWITIFDQLILAEQHIDIASARPPTGRYLAALRNALTRLSGSGRSVTVRVLLGADPLDPVDPAATLAALTRDLGPDTTLSVSVGSWSQHDAWSRLRLIAVDHEVLITGGHDLDDASYLGRRPVHDLSMLTRGDPAFTASTFLDRVWGPLCEDPSPLTTSDVATFPVEAACPAQASLGAPVPVRPDTVAISVGRLGPLGEDPADVALLAALRAADRTIRLSQQDLLPALLPDGAPSPWTEDVLLELAFALARGVEVYAALSDSTATPSGPSSDLQRTSGWTAAQTARAIETFIGDHPGIFPRAADVHALLCEQLHVAPLRFGPDAAWADGTGFANHASVLVVDDEVFYLGSQALADSAHASFGMFIDDLSHTRALLAEYWSPLWAASRAAAVSGEGACSF
jgi:phosphatidylserine/phosphatidylglycerophosphate/cardiolipin synthase-like enzyme